MRQFEKLFSPMVAGFLLLVLPSLLFGQATTLGNILGTTTDPSGATVPNAEVQVTNTDTGVARQTTTDDSGNFAVRSLTPGVYRVEVSAPSFQRQVQENIRLDVAATVNLNFHLTVGQVTETVQVEAEAPMLQTTEGTVSTVIENAQVVELPLNGRNFNNLVRLTPGASRGANSGGNTLNAQTWSVTGSRSDTNYYSLDGMFNNGTFFKTAAIAPSIDSIQEFKIQTNMSARYGAAAGANINVVTKSGTNELHGTLYEFLRNQKLDSRDYFARSRPHFRHNQFGGSAGGPIMIPGLYDGRNRSFWFFNYEGFRERRGVTQVFTVPTPAMLSGDLSRTISGAPAPPIYDPLTTRPNPSGAGFIRTRFPDNQIPANRIQPYAAAYAGLWFPKNLIPGVSAGNYINDTLNRRDDNQVTTRIDQKLTDNNNIFGRFTWQNLEQISPQNMPTAFRET
ncbi:MAG: carboxypeptidase regulatory-like domain-containing protein, partial [Bryobacteraceae bacterium]